MTRWTVRGLLVLVSLLAGRVVADQPDEPATTNLLRLRAATVDTRTLANLLDEKAVQPAAQPGARRYVVQLSGPVTTAQRDALAAAGVLLGDYLPDHAYFAQFSTASPADLTKLDFVAWVGEYRPEWKLDPAIGHREVPFQTPERIALEAAGKLQLAVTLFEGVALEQAMVDIAALGAEVRDGGMVGPQGVVTVVVTPQDIARLADEPSVQFVEEASEVTFRNSTNRWIVQSNVVNVTPLYDHGIHGEGQLIGIIDGKVDSNHCSFSDTNPIGPTHRKIEAYNATLGADSHGTHVAGTCVGDAGADNDTRGVAYLGRLVYAGIPSFTDTAVYNALQTHHNQGARVHTNSWGNDGTTSYDGLARGFDRFQYDFEDSLCCLAVTNTSTLKNPENAKNLLAVGASQDTPNQGSHCSGGVGPTADGRRKPEIYAPGCSTSSSSSGTSCGLRSLTGTSMASPAVAGTAMLVRQYYMDGFYPTGTAVVGDAFVPSAALVKATLLNSAVDMTGISGYPSNLEGWGRVLVDNALYFDGDARTLVVEDVWNASGLTTGQSATLDFTVSGSAQQLRVTLVFTDAPGTAGAGAPVVNNLDLEVTAPDGTTVYKGNVFSAGQSIPGGSADALNNVEQVHLSNPATGQWEAKVKATAVNQGTQGYALVITGEVNLGPAPPQTANVDLQLPVDVPTNVQLDGSDIDQDPLDFIITSLPAHGGLSDPGAGPIAAVPYTLVSYGDQVTYTPDPGYAGTDGFRYKANDGGVPPTGGDSNESSVTLLVVADAPQITTLSLPDGEAGSPYGPVQLQVSGGQPVVTWELLADVPYVETDLGTSGFAEVGAARGWNGDDQFWDYALPFAFPFYDNVYTTVRVWSNGFLNFGLHAGSSYSNTTQLLIDNVRIAPLWDDLKTNVTGMDIYIDESVADQVTFRWKAVTFSGSHPCDFSATLHADGAIEFHYGPGNAPITATVGISAGDGTRYTLASYDPATALTNANSLRFARPDQLSPGLSVSPDGVLSGIPQQAGDFLPVLRVTDGLNRTDEAAIPLTILAPLGDFDGDGDVDLLDWAALADCLGGPGNVPPATPPVTVSACLDTFDFDLDLDVDLADCAAFAQVLAAGSP